MHFLKTFKIVFFTFSSFSIGHFLLGKRQGLSQWIGPYFSTIFILLIFGAFWSRWPASGLLLRPASSLISRIWGSGGALGSRPVQWARWKPGTCCTGNYCNATLQKLLHCKKPKNLTEKVSRNASASIFYIFFGCSKKGQLSGILEREQSKKVQPKLNLICRKQVGEQSNESNGDCGVTFLLLY